MACNILKSPLPEQSAAILNSYVPLAVSAINSQEPSAANCKGYTETIAGRYYYIKFEGNNSQRWDGKVISIPSSQIEDTYYDQSQLVPGFIITLPWPSKGNKKVINWKAVIVEPKMEKESSNSSSRSCAYLHGVDTIFQP